MRYLCVHCDHRFEADELPRRCPSCMRATGVQEVHEQAASARETRRSPARALGLALVVVAAAVAGYFVWGRRPSAGERGTLKPLSQEELSDALQEAHAKAGELAQLLETNDAIAAFAKRAAGGEKSPYDKAEALTRAIRARASALSFVPWSLAEPRTTPIGTAAQTLPKLLKDRGRAELYPLEVSALMVAALRSLDVPAMVAELISVEGERAPLDPSGYLGYFAVAVYAGEPGLGTPRLYDPYGGRPLGVGAKWLVLSDPQAIGAALAIRALHETGYLADPRKALETSNAAIQLAGTLPSVRTSRGMVVLAGRQVEQGLAELAAARQLRADAPRLHNIASVELMTGDVEHATKDLQAALERSPDFAAAHATLGSLALVRGDREQAQAELASAEKLAPDLSLVLWAQAEQHFRQGERDQALSLARRALRERPSFDAHLRMGVLLREAARFDELRALTAELLAMTPAYRQADVREMVANAFGAAALDADAKDVDAPDDGVQGEGATPALPVPTLQEPGTGSEPRLRLGEGLKLKLGD